MERLICVLIGYTFGLFETGYFYGRMKNIDIRQHGSGNAGTTNTLRTLGWKAGVITFIGDCLKCILAVGVVRLIFGNSHPDTIKLLTMYTGMGAVLGHNYPFYMKFKGGKGIATTAGLFLTTNPWMAVISMIVFILIVAITRYVSVASLILMILFAVEVIWYGQRGGFGLLQPQLYEVYAIAIFLTLSAFYKHKVNIKQLLNGTENKFGTKKK